MDLLSTSFFYPSAVTWQLLSPSCRLQPNELPLLFVAFSLSWTAGCQRSNNPVRRLYWDQLIIRGYGLVFQYWIAIPADISLWLNIPTFTVRDWYSVNSSLSAEPERGFSVYYNVAANEAWCKGCRRRRMFEIMDKIWRCGRREFEGTEDLEAGDGFTPN